MRDEILEALINKIAQLTQKDASTLSGETDLKGELPLKSIEVAAITAMLEEEYDVYIKYTDMVHAKSINEMADIAMKEIDG